MEYSKLLKQAYEHTKKYKAMWWLGMLVASGGGGASNINIPSGDFGDSVSPSESELDRWFLQIGDWFVEYWYIFLAIGILLIALVLVSIALHFIATGGMYYGANEARLNKKLTFKNMFQAGMKHFWKVVGLHLLIGVGSTLAVVVSLVVIVLIGITIIGLVIAIPAFIIFLIALLPFTAAVSIMTNYATQYVVLEQQSIKESLRNSWELFRAKLSDSVVIYLLSVVVKIGIGLATFGVVLVIALPFAIIGFILYNSFGWIPVVVTIALGVIVLMVVLLFVKGLKHTYFFNLWHLTFAELTEK